MSTTPPPEPASLSAARSAFAADVREGLSGQPKRLAPRYFYDALGSQLFEAICELPWYPITRAERRLLERNARRIVEPLGDLRCLVELGSGSGEKLALLARAALERAAGKAALKDGRRPAVSAHLIDISEKALELSHGTLSRLHGLEVVGHRSTYEEGLRRIAAARSDRGTTLALFLGSNIGNFDPPAAAELLRAIRGGLRAGDGLLLGADLVRTEAELLLAYDDPLGVTAAFDKNVLQRINAELGGDFDLAAFDHKAVFCAAHARVEMHLVSRRRQVARIPGADIEAAFEEGESIWTESSYKYTPERIIELGRRAGFGRHQQWIEERGRFSTTLFLVD